MNTRTWRPLCVAAVGLVVIAHAAKADPVIDNDPFFSESLSPTNCPGGSTGWCASEQLATDPLSGIKTLEFTFNSNIPTVTAGDVKIDQHGTTTVGNVIRFEDIGGVAVAFIFSDDNPGATADVGLPSSFQSDTITLAAPSSNLFTFTPTSTQPGYCSGQPKTDNYCSPGVTGGTEATYGLTDADKPVSDPVPEPSSMAVLGAGLLGLNFLRRRSRTKA